MGCDYTRPSTWRPYIQGMCQDCHADCCRLPVEARLEEFVKMGLALPDEVTHDARNLIKRLKKEGVIRLFDLKSSTAILSQKSDGSCYFLGKDRRCTIYEGRPGTCRDFPKIGPRPGLCPYNKK